MRVYLLTGLPALMLLAVLTPVALAEADADGQPSPPQNLSISHLSDALLVSWDPPASGTVDAYFIERATSLGTEPPVFVDAETTQFFDAIDLVGDFVAAYQVTALFSDGTQASAMAGAAFLEWVPSPLGPFCSVMIGSETSADGHCWIDFLVDAVPPDCPQRESTRLTLHGTWDDIVGVIAFVKSLVPVPSMGVGP